MRHLLRRFPKRLGIVWFQGEDRLENPAFVENLKKWRTLNPTWEVLLLDDAALRAICYRYSTACGQLYDRFDVMHLKIDFGRYVALWDTIGMYVDMDCFALRPLDQSHHVQELISRYETHGQDVVGLSEINIGLLEKWISGCEVNNAVMMASPRNPAMGGLIDALIREQYIPLPYSSNSFLHVMNTTGPFRFNRYWREECKDQSGITRFPYYVFEPGGMYQRNYDLRADTVAIHTFEGSWISPGWKSVFKFYYHWIKPYGWVIILTIILVFAYTYTSQRKTRSTRSTP